jgi:hypothetical protein
MKTPCNHSRLAWTSIRAGAVAGAIVVLLCRAALGQTIPNPSFEADTFTVWPGYVGDQTPPTITGWTVDAPEGAGLNPIADGRSPFADNGAIPDGKQVLFIQSGANTSETTVSTTISGLTVGTTYKVTLQANARGGQSPHLRISIDGTELLAFTMCSAGGSNPYWYIAFEFTATATSHVLGLMNDTATDNTVLVDNVQIAPSSGKWVVDAWNDDASSGLDSSFYYTHAYKFGNLGNFSINGVAFTGLGGNNPQVAGSFATTFLTYGPAGGGATVSGESTNLAVNFDYGYSIPPGSSESITLYGLTPGTNYVATIFSYAWDDPTVDSLDYRWATFSMGDDRLTVQQDEFGLDNGIRVSYSYTADSTGTATIDFTPINTAANVSFHVCGFANREAVSRFVAPVITTQPHTAIVTPGLPVNFTVLANGLPAPTYQWRFDGTNIDGATNATWAIGATYSLDNDIVNTTLNASDGTETVDNWWANEFTAVAGGNVITRVDFSCGTVTTNSSAMVCIYRVTDPGGNPALGATRLYSQSFTPVPGPSHLNQIYLSTPVALNVGDIFLVAIFIPNVIALSPNDVYPFALDSGTSSTGSYWDRSTNAFNLDDLSQAVPLDQALPDDGSGANSLVPSTYGGHLIIRAVASASASTAGNYDVVVTNSQGSVTSTVAQLIFGLPLANPSFEDDIFGTFPGYCSGAANGPITGWTLDSLGGGGINPTPSGSPFASSGPIPDGQQFAFIQAGGDILHQTVSGFTVGNPYYVHYYEGARAGYPSPGMQVTVGGATVLAAHAIPAGANSCFETFSDVFTATNASLDVAFIKSNPVSGDTTAVLDDVAIVSIAPGTAPFITRNPQPLLVSVGDSATFWAQGDGSPTLAFQWLKNGVAVTGATTEFLTLNDIQKAADADYSLMVANSSGSVTSAVAHLTVYEPIPDLYNTGVDNNHVGLADDSTDPHYQLILNPDTGSTNAIVEDSTVYPISTATWMVDTATSRWIGPEFNTGSSAGGNYVYRTVIDLTGRDPSTLIINGQWASDNTGTDIQVNGHSTGNPQCLTFASFTAFNIYGTNGLFVAGTNNIDFLVNNAGQGYTGLRVEIIRSNVRIPPGIPPTILTAPVGQTATVGDTITFTATANGTAPLSYQWEENGVAIPGQTTLSLTLTNVTTADSGFYSILVSNSVGSTNSPAAALNVAYRAIPSICFGTGVAADGTLLAAPAVDPHYILAASADPNFPGPDAIVISNAWPIASGVWALNGPNSVWIAPQADQSGTTYTNGTYGGNAEGDYDYETSFDLTGQNLSMVFISGGWATDNTGTDILVNGVSSGNTNGSFSILTPFILTATNGLVAGPNTLDFLVNNAPSTPNPTGLRVDLRLMSIIAPKLQAARSGSNLNMVWWPTFGSQQLLSAPTPLGPWTVVSNAISPFTIPIGPTNAFYRVH